MGRRSASSSQTRMRSSPPNTCRQSSATSGTRCHFEREGCSACKPLGVLLTPIMPDEIRHAAGDVDAVRRIYLAPEITDEYEITVGEPDVPGVMELLCGERAFSKDRVTAALERAFSQRSF